MVCNPLMEEKNVGTSMRIEDESEKLQDPGLLILTSKLQDEKTKMDQQIEELKTKLECQEFMLTDMQFMNDEL